MSDAADSALLPGATTDGGIEAAAAPDVVSTNTDHYQELLSTIATSESSEGAPDVVPDGVARVVPETPAEPAASETQATIDTLRAQVRVEFATEFAELKAMKARLEEQTAVPETPAPVLPTPAEAGIDPFELAAKHDLGDDAQHVNAFVLGEMTDRLRQLHQWTVYSQGSARTPEDKATAKQNIDVLSHKLNRLKYDAQRDASNARIEAQQNQMANALDPVQTQASYAAELPALFEHANMPHLQAHAKAGLPLDICFEGVDFTLLRGDEAGEKKIAHAVYQQSQVVERILASLASAGTTTTTTPTGRAVTPPKNLAILTPPPGVPTISGEIAAPTTNAEYWKQLARIPSKSN